MTITEKASLVLWKLRRELLADKYGELSVLIMAITLAADLADIEVDAETDPDPEDFG